jgi:hypothetical protein
MLLDNESTKRKVHEWLTEKYIDEGKLDIVTGYFTIGALAYMSKQVNERISEFRMILGDIVNFDDDNFRPLDLLNEDISIEAALKLSSLSKEAVELLMNHNYPGNVRELMNVIKRSILFCQSSLLLPENIIFPPDNKDDVTANVNLNLEKVPFLQIYY